MSVSLDVATAPFPGPLPASGAREEDVVQCGQQVAMTAVVVSCDEGELLKRCLPAMSFCEELIVVDMESTDDTTEVARQHGAQVVARERAPFIEAAQKWMSSIAAHDWIFVVDPDEVVDARLAVELQSLLPHLPEDVAVVEIPWLFYFGTQPLRGGYWGGRNWKSGCIFHRQRVDLDGMIHQRATPKQGFRTHRLPWSDGNVLHHYWMRDYRQFVQKHRRYILAEGERHQQLGRRFSWLRMGWVSLHSFLWAMLKKGGWRDGMTGVGLSGFYAWYVASGWMSLRRLERTS